MQRGFIMIETIVAIAIIGTAMVAMLVALSTTNLITKSTSVKSTVAWVATSQTELILGTGFDVPLPYATVTPPEGYEITVLTSPDPECDDPLGVGDYERMRTVCITIMHGGEVVYENAMIVVDRG